MANSSNPDPSDLDLRLTPFERCYNLDTDMHIGLDSIPFDPVAEAERADRIAYQTPVQWHGRRFMWWRFRKPLFTVIPGPERRAWWLDYFQSQRDPGAQDADLGLPGWVSTVLATDRETSLAQIATALGQRGVDGLLLRGVLHRYTDAEITHVKAMIPGPISDPSVATARMKYEFTENAFVSIALGLLPPDEVIDLMRTSRTREQVSLNRHGALLGLAMPDPQDRLLFVRTGFHAMDWKCLSPWVAGLESRGLDPLLSYIKHSGSEEAKALLSETGALVHGPGAAPFFFAALDSTGATAAVEWIRAHPPAIQKATLPPRDTRRAAIFLREQEVSRIPTGELKGPLRKLPINPASLPPLKMAGKTLPLKEVAGLVEAMKKDEEPQLAAALKAHMKSEDLDEFALAILDGWLFSGSVAHDRSSLVGRQGICRRDKTFDHTMGECASQGRLSWDSRAGADRHRGRPVSARRPAREIAHSFSSAACPYRIAENCTEQKLVPRRSGRSSIFRHRPGYTRGTRIQLRHPQVPDSARTGRSSGGPSNKW